MIFRQLHTLEELQKMDIGEKIGRALVFLLGLGLAFYGFSQGFSILISLIVIAGFSFMALEKRAEVSDVGKVN